MNAAGIELEFTPISELDRIRRKRDDIIDVLAAHGLTNVGVFGSVARGEETSASDIDLLVDVAPDTGLLSIIRAQDELETLLGREIDLIPRAGLKPRVAIDVAREVVTLRVVPAWMLTTESDVDWDDIAKMRDHLAHHDFDTAHSIIFAVARRDVPDLVAAARHIQLARERADLDPIP